MRGANLDTLPFEIILKIMKIIEEQNSIQYPIKGFVRELCAYTRISPSFREVEDGISVRLMQNEKFKGLKTFSANSPILAESSEASYIKLPFQLHTLHLHSDFTTLDALISAFFTPSFRSLAAGFDDKNGIISSSLHRVNSMTRLAMSVDDIKLMDLHDYPPTSLLELSVRPSLLAHFGSIIAHFPGENSMREFKLGLVQGYSIFKAHSDIIESISNILPAIMTLSSLKQLEVLGITHSDWITEHIQKLLKEEWKKRGIKTTFIIELEDLPQVQPEYTSYPI